MFSAPKGNHVGPLEINPSPLYFYIANIDNSGEGGGGVAPAAVLVWRWQVWRVEGVEGVEGQAAPRFGAPVTLWCIPT
jgi:hypothetical protein